MGKPREQAKQAAAGAPLLHKHEAAMRTDRLANFRRNVAAGTAHALTHARSLTPWSFSPPNKGLVRTANPEVAREDNQVRAGEGERIIGRDSEVAEVKEILGRQPATMAAMVSRRVVPSGMGSVAASSAIAAIVTSQPFRFWRGSWSRDCAEARRTGRCRLWVSSALRDEGG
jgi:hypothetical protein